MPIKVSTIVKGAMLILNQGYSDESTAKYIQATQKLSPAFTMRRLGSSCSEYSLIHEEVKELIDSLQTA